MWEKCLRERMFLSFFVKNWVDFDSGENWKEAYCIIRN